MTLEYIAGFFDADGSVVLNRRTLKETKSLTVNFTNCDRGILEAIKEFFEKELGAKGYFITYKKSKEHHLQSFDLRYYTNNARIVGEQLMKVTKHSKKYKRLALYFEKCRPLIKANGKYTPEERTDLEAIAEEFNAIK